MLGRLFFVARFARRAGSVFGLGGAAVCAVVVSTSIVLAARPDEPEASLRPKDVTEVDRIERAYIQGAPLAVVSRLAPLAADKDGQLVPLVDQEFAKRLMPSTADLLLEARLSLLQQGFADSAPRPGHRETIYLLQALESRIDDLESELDGHALMADPLVGPSTLDAYETLLWDSHVLENHLLLARRLVQYQMQLAAGFPRRALARFTPAERATVTTDYRQALGRIDERHHELLQRDTEMRMNRLAVARAALEQPELTPEKFKAAYVWTVDARLIDQFLTAAKEARRPLTRQKLADPGYVAAATADVEKARELAGDLTQKATWLFEGLHWWLRGRYGAGAELGGLVKSQESLRSPESMFQLYMPHDEPQPTDPAAGDAESPSPTYDRRHHYWWALEDRGVSSHSGQFSKEVDRQVAAGPVVEQSIESVMQRAEANSPFW